MSLDSCEANITDTKFQRCTAQWGGGLMNRGRGITIFNSTFDQCHSMTGVVP